MKRLFVAVVVVLSLLSTGVFAENVTTGSGIETTTNPTEKVTQGNDSQIELADLSYNGKVVKNELLVFNDNYYISQERFQMITEAGDNAQLPTNGNINGEKAVSVSYNDDTKTVSIYGIEYVPVDTLVDTKAFGITKDAKGNKVSIESIEYAKSIFDITEIEATTTRDVTVYKSKTLSGSIGTLKKGTVVKIKAENTPVSYRVYSGKVDGWVKDDYLKVSTKSYVDKDLATKFAKETFANFKAYKSDTSYLVWTNIERQEVNVFKKATVGKWALIRTFSCSSGKNTTPTINGEFKYYQNSGRVNYDGFHINNFMRFSGHYGMHSVLLKSNGTYYDSRVGIPLSHGCIRMPVADSNWMVKTIPVGTKVVIY
jgi:lipoprotein-anchoring transpeptidase ErfK/SrfK